MYQILVVLISFSIIPILIRKKVRLSFTLLVTAGLLSVFSGIGISKVVSAFSSVFLEPAPRATLLTVLMVSILGGLMGKYGLLGRIVKILGKTVKNKKNTLILIPALAGFLPIPGGALLSAPFVNNIGEELELSPERRTVINLVFRHIAMFVMPYSTGLLIIASSFPDLNIIKIILLNTVFIGLIIGTGYFLYIKDIKVELLVERKDLARNLLKILVLLSPIYVPVVVSLTTGLPFYITLIFSIAIVYALGSKEDFITNIIKSISWNTILTVAIILIIKEIILGMDSLLLVFESMLAFSQNSFYILLIFLITSLFFGLITGNQAAPLAVVLPMIYQLNVETNLPYIFLAFGSAFIGYYFSPLHL